MLVWEFIKNGQLIEYILTHYRGLFACVFLLPLSVVFEAILYLRNKYIFYTNIAPKQHDERVRQVQSQVKAWIDDGMKMKLCTARPGWQTISLRVGKYKKTSQQINVSLKDVLEVNTSERTVRVEPLVTMGQLTATLNPIGWTIPVVPELDDLTVGGLVNGFGIESSSHIYGLFQHICTAFEIVRGDGTVVRCSKSENPDLFYAIPWSYGTLGFLVAAEIKMIPFKKYVHLRYIPCYTRKDYCNIFEKESLRTDADRADFIEGLVYSKETAVIMLGKTTNAYEKRSYNPIGNYYKPWFYKHVEGFLSSGTSEEYIPLRHYYHRHTRSIFWELSDIIPFGNNPVFRYIAGWMVPPKISLLKLTQTETTRKLYELNHVVQDMLVPIKGLEDAIDCFHKEYQLYPLWLCPMKVTAEGYADHGGMLRPHNGKDDMFVDIGAYGNPKAKSYHFQDTARRVEAYVRKVGGAQALYADCYMTKSEFAEMFDHTAYNKLRKEANAEQAFPEIYDKICKKNRH